MANRRIVRLLVVVAALLPACGASRSGVGDLAGASGAAGPAGGGGAGGPAGSSGAGGGNGGGNAAGAGGVVGTGGDGGASGATGAGGSLWGCFEDDGGGLVASTCGSASYPASGPPEGEACACDRQICIGPNMCGLNHPRQCLDGKWVILESYCGVACDPSPTQDVIAGSPCIGPIAGSCTYATSSGCQVLSCTANHWTATACADGGATDGG
jgi:hypothetical protein